MSKKYLIELDPKNFSNDLDYYPLKKGLIPSTMGLSRLPKYSDRRDNIFQFGDSFNSLRNNKIKERNERVSKYYQKIEDSPLEIIKFIIHHLLTEYPNHFKLQGLESGKKELSCLLTGETICFGADYRLDSETGNKTNYLDLFDALAMQLTEDLVIHKIDEKKDYASQIHLFHPNGWSAEGAIGKSFDFIHQKVEGIHSIVPNTQAMMMRILESENSFERVAAINFKTNKYFNRHPDWAEIYNTPFNLKNPELYIRLERQTVTGFPNSRAFLFTIRTYMYDLNPKILGKEMTKVVYDTFKTPNSRVYSINFIERNRDEILKWYESYF